MRRSKKKAKENGFNPFEKKVPRRVVFDQPKVKATTDQDIEDLLPERFRPPRDEVTGVEENEQSKRFLGLLQVAYQAAQDAALATAQLELQVVTSKADESGEVPDEFEADRFLTTQRKLLELRVLKDFVESFGLGVYLDRIMAVRIDALFGSHPVSVTAPGGKSFYGTDEAFLKYRTKTSLKGT